MKKSVIRQRQNTSCNVVSTVKLLLTRYNFSEFNDKILNLKPFLHTINVSKS